MKRSITFLPVAGDLASADALVIRRARQLAEFLRSDAVVYSHFVSTARTSDGGEVVCFDVDVEVGQAPVNDILRRERIAVVFTVADGYYPVVHALRSDFPLVPHLGLQFQEFPRSLCLYEQSWHEVKVRWTAPGFVERIRDWLSRTSEGTLHLADQPLEPLISGPLEHLVIPSDLSLDPASTESLVVYRHGADADTHVYIAGRPDNAPPGQYAPRFVTTTFISQPQQHGIIRLQPRTLAELDALLKEAGVDLIGGLKEQIGAWNGKQDILHSHLIIIVFFPKTRQKGSEVESTETWAFVTEKAISDIGSSLGVSGSLNGLVVPLIGTTASSKNAAATAGADIPIGILNPTQALSRGLAAQLNGLPSAQRTAITAVGVGALGSQLVPYLVRAGYGRWTLIDDDVLLPHNVARHALTSHAVGFRKAEFMSGWLNSILDEPDVTRFISANVLSPGKHSTEVEAALDQSDVILDLSASLAVSRHLATASAWRARRVSLFLNPYGSDLIVLAEDTERRFSLDVLEMFYYREVVQNNQLSTHLRNDSGPVRYARSCRDLTTVIPGELIGMHAAIGSRAVREALSSDGPSIRIWQTAADLSVTLISVPYPNPIRRQCGDWTVVSDENVLSRMFTLRSQRLPNETGGVLIGHFDVDRKTVYVADILSSPPDSKEWPTVYIRGAEGLSASVTDIQTRTASMLQYVGEWHSHPDGYSCLPSGEDKRAFVWLVELMELDGYPGVMLIAASDEHAWFLGKME